MKLPRGFTSLGRKNEYINNDVIVDVSINKYNKAVITDKFGNEYQIDVKLLRKEK